MATLAVKNCTRCLLIILSLFYAASAMGAACTGPPRGGSTTKYPQQNLWFYFNSTARAYSCSQVRSTATGIECFESGPALAFGYCATYSEDTKSLSIICECPYYYV